MPPEAIRSEETGSKRGPHVERRVNVRLVMLTFGILAAVGLIVHLVHAAVVASTVGHLKDRALAAEQDDPDAAVGFYSQYLQFEPRDTEALLRLGRLLDDTETASFGTLRRVYFLYETVLNDAGRGEFQLTAEDASEIRDRLVDLLIRFGRYEDALNPHLRKLKEEARESGDLAELGAEYAREGLCQARLRNVPEAIGAYVRAASLAPEEIDHHAALAGLLQNAEADRLQRDDLPADEFVAADLRALFPDPEAEPDTPPLKTGERVDRVLSRMVEHGEPKHEALRTRAVILARRGDESLEAAWNDLLAAQEAAPEDADRTPWLLAAIEVKRAQAVSHQVNKRTEEANAALDEASEFVEEGLRQDPPELEFYLQRYQVDRTVATLSTADELVDRLKVAVNALATGIEETRRRAEEAREEGRERAAAGFEALEPNLRWALGDLLIDVADLDEAGRESHLEQAQEEIAALDELRYDRGRLDFLRARIAYEDADYAETLAILERVRPLLADRRDLQRRIDVLLGTCYAALSNEEARYRTFARSLVDDPNWSFGRVQLADSLAQLGRFDQAVEEYAKLGNAAIVPLAVSEIELRRQRQRPEDRRDFRRLKSVLAQAEKTFPDAPQIDVLWAQSLLLEGEREAAGRRLDEALVDHPDDVALRAMRIRLAVRSGDFEEAEPRLAAALDELGPQPELIASAIALAISRGNADQKKSALGEVESFCDEMTGENRHRSLHMLASAYANDAVGTPEESVRLWKRIAKEFPSDLSSRLQLFYAADEEDRDRWLAEIERVEGQSGPNGSFLKAQQWLADHADKLADSPTSQVRQVRDWLQTAVEQRPGWSAPHRLRGQLEDALGRGDVALREFERAFELGDHSERTVAHLVRSYYRDQRFADVSELNRRLSADPATILGDEFENRIGQINRLAEWQQRQLDRTRTAINKLAADSDQAAVARPALDAFTKLERLRMLSRSEREGDVGQKLLDEASREFEGLFQQAPSAGWLRELYVAGLVRVGELEKAREAIGTGMQLSDDPAFETEKSRALARCRRMINDVDAAERRYLRAIAASPRDAALRQELIDFYVRGEKLDEALKHVDALIDPAFGAEEKVVNRAKAVRSVISAAKGKTFREFEEILSQLRTAESTEELRARAALLARSPFRSSRAELADVLEELNRRPDAELSDGDRFLLARLYAGIDRWEDAEKLFRELLADNPEDPMLVTTLASGLLEQKRYDDVEPLADRLDEITPNSFLSTSLRARLLHGRGRTDEAVTLIEDFAAQIGTTDDPGEQFAELLAQEKGDEALKWLAGQLDADADPAVRKALDEARQLLDRGNHDAAVARLRLYLQQAKYATLAQRFLYLASARLLDGFDRHDAAEGVFRPYAEATDRPQDWLVVSTYLARQDKTTEALDVVERVSKDTEPAQVAGQAIATLREAVNPPAEQIARVETWIKDALAEEPESPQLLVRLADLRDFQERFDEVHELYERVLTLDPDNAVATNNLAWLLALRDGDPRAVTLMDRLVDRIGPHPELLDTRGMVHVATGQPDKGVRDLERSVEATRDGLKYLHLAFAYDAAGHPDRAQDALDQAKENGVDPERVHPLERSLLKRLTEQLP